MGQITRSSKTLPNSAKLDKPTGLSAPGGGILLTATELFASRNRHDVEDKRVFLELAQNLLPSTNVKDRRRIANLLAAHPEMPDHLLERLATDEDELTAFSALRYSPRLSVDLLLHVAKTGSDTLRKAVANRPSLRESVIAALCENGGANVVRILLDRDDVILSPNHQETLSNRTEIVAELGLELAGQNALSPDGLMSQFLHLPAPLRAKAVAAAEMTNLVRRAQTPRDNNKAEITASRLKLLDGLKFAAKTQNKTGFADLLGQGLNLPQSTCDLLLQDDQGEGLVVALKALSMNAADTAMVLVRLMGQQVPLTGIRSLLRFHKTLSLGAAGVLVGQWMLQNRDDAETPVRQAPHYQESKKVQGAPKKKRVVARVSTALRTPHSKAE